ncbi:MAG: FHA domain-containing protein [Planctomycetota bacterium]
MAKPRAVDVRLTAVEPESGGLRKTLAEARREDHGRKIIGSEELGGGEELDEAEGGTHPFRPSHRPPIPLLRVFDDNQSDGETIRVRGNPFIIGRNEGDLIIPHDNLISGRHAEIARHFEDGKVLWRLYDLNSRNGSFVKIDFIRLRVGDELILGATTYVFQESRQSSPRLVQVGSRHPREVTFEQEEFWIGRDPAHGIPAFTDDHLLEEKHARVQYTRGKWCLMAAPSTNGVWARIDQIELGHGTRFQLGEQRFQVLLP